MPQCAACGRGDLMQAQIRTYQCLACGSVMDEQQNVLPTQVKGPNLYNAGLPVKELGDTAEVVSSARPRCRRFAVRLKNSWTKR